MGLLVLQDQQVLQVPQVQQEQLAQQVLLVPPLQSHIHTVPPQDKQHLAVPISTH
jgi:hypothetical protein